MTASSNERATVHTLCTFNQQTKKLKKYLQKSSSILNNQTTDKTWDNLKKRIYQSTIVDSAWAVHNIAITMAHHSQSLAFPLIRSLTGMPEFQLVSYGKIKTRCPVDLVTCKRRAGKTLSTQLSVPVQLWHCADQLVLSDTVSGGEDFLDTFLWLFQTRNPLSWPSFYTASLFRTARKRHFLKAEESLAWMLFVG